MGKISDEQALWAGCYCDREVLLYKWSLHDGDYNVKISWMVHIASNPGLPLPERERAWYTLSARALNFDVIARA